MHWTTMSSLKLITLCLVIAAVSALPQNGGYSYQSHQPAVTSYTTGSHSYSQPSVTVGHYETGHGSLGHGIVSGGHIGTVSHGSVGHTSISHGIGSGGYDGGHSVISSGSYGGGHGVISSGSYGGGHGVVSSGSYHGGTVGETFHGFPDAPLAASVGTDYVQTSSGHNVVEEHHGHFGHPLITKSFHTFIGPEDHDEKSAIHHLTIGKPQKHYRVIFIKNPSSSVNRALIKAHLAPTEEKTVVYVLSKNHNELDIQSEIDEPAPIQPSRPDVVFVKYKHPEEIHHLQETVQHQYSSIPGENQILGEEHAPVRSIISSVGEESISYGGNIGHIGGHSGSSTYTSYGHGSSGSSGQIIGGHVGGSTYESSTISSGGSYGGIVGHGSGLVGHGSGLVGHGSGLVGHASNTNSVYLPPGK